MQNNGVDCSKLLQKLSETGIYITDLTLFLDTHPEDTDALNMLCEAIDEHRVAREAFEKCCYPLTVCTASCDEWDWLCGIWPGERS